ncbi:MAG: methionine adenosyltransferase, partial [Clostridia bacterium]|nr:methionine adenosyltransferase [Clostridia bacterium]
MVKYFSSESVTEGHPDKLCDRVSDSVLDAILAQDPAARVACETACTTGLILVMGEITTTAQVDIAAIARNAVREIGFDRAKMGFDCDTCSVLTSLDKQSADIALGVDKSLEAKNGDDSEFDIGAGDQGMMFGYACDETETLMPLPIYLAHRLAYRLTEVRKQNIIKGLYPDGKTQVTVQYEDDIPVRVDSVVVSTQHSEETDLDFLRVLIEKEVIRAIIPEKYLDENTKIYINPTGRFVVGGPHGDSGLTGRKIIVDTYGGY